MENSPSTTTRIAGRKNTYKRDSYNYSISDSGKNYPFPQNELKMLTMLSLINLFNQNKQKIIEKYQQQAEEKLRKNQINSNNNSSIFVIQPLKKQIVNLRLASKQLQKLKQQLIASLNSFAKRQIARKSVNYSFPAFQLTQTSSQINNKLLSSTVDNSEVLPKAQKTYFKQQSLEKENINPHKNSNTVHRRFFSDLTFMSMTRKTSPVKQISNGKRRQIYFMSKKKQQMNFLRKITVEFTSNQAQFKVLVQTLELFLKNLTRTNYYLKMIDQNVQKCQKMSVYINELNKLFNKIQTKLLEISKLHKALTISENIIKICRTQFKFSLKEVQNYQQKSNSLSQIIRHFLSSPTFQVIMKPKRLQCSKLISLLVESRYILRYLQKQIENSQATRKQFAKMPKWQKAFRVKFLPKNALC